MYALDCRTTVAVSGGCGIKATMRGFGFLWAELVAQPVRAAPKVIGMADNKWKQLQYRPVGRNLEQPCHVGGDC